MARIVHIEVDLPSSAVIRAILAIEGHYGQPRFTDEDRELAAPALIALRDAIDAAYAKT